MRSYRDHLIPREEKIIDALKQLNVLAADAILFVVDSQDKLIGSLTDGDIRRGFLKGLRFEDGLDKFIQPDPRFINKDTVSIEEVINFRESGFKVIPVIDKQGTIVNVVNFARTKSYLPVDAMIMAGGRGERLRPLTDTIPKPLLNVAGKPIMEYCVEQLANYGIEDVWVSVRYLGKQIEDHFGDGASHGVRIHYVQEEEPLGTAGAVGLATSMKRETILLMNADLITNIDLEDFYREFRAKNADIAVACIPYLVNIPYGVIDVVDGKVMSFREKPTYTYYSNAGIYLMKRHVRDLVAKNKHLNATDLIDKVLASGGNVVNYTLIGYWLDIGKPEDYAKAQEEVKHLKFG